jgi:cyanate permease
MTSSTRSLILIPTWILYVGLMFVTIVCEVAGTNYYFGATMSPDAIVAGMDSAIYIAPWIIVPILIRWMFEQATWGTFAVYSILLGTAFILQATLQRILENYGLSELLFVLATGCLVSFAYFMYKNVLHMQAIRAEAQKMKRKPGRR